MKQDILSREFREESLKSIHALHRAGANGIEVALQLTKLHDRLLEAAFFATEQSEKRRLALVALGGYGRGELCFGSDIDLMLLVEDTDTKEHARHAITSVLHSLLDCGLDVGHSVRTIDDCLGLKESDFESWLSLLEARLICGNRSLFAHFRAVLQRAVATQDHAEFVRRLSRLSGARQFKYGDSSKLLEPNIKNSAGGLRDLHTALWILRGTGAMPLHPVTGRQTTATLLMLQSLQARKLLLSSQAAAVRRASAFLLRVRSEVHLRAKGLQDMLSFSLQPQIATSLRYHQRTHRSKVEHFMQDYYVAARTVSQLAARLMAWAQDRWLRPSEPPRPQVINEQLECRSGRIHLRKSTTRVTNEVLLQAFVYRLEHGAEFSFELEDRIHRSLSRIKPLATQLEGTLWSKILNAPQGVAAALQTMNGIGLLGPWIPEWKPLVAFFQHNQYHFYTADEHTLLVLAAAEKLAGADSAFGQVFRSLPRRDVLYWACLLHDIAKPVQVLQHETLGVPMARAVMQRLHASAMADDVAFLVRHHLMMEQVAFRRNLSDPQTVMDFARHFEHVHQLDYLYVLTYADLSAVNKNVLTEWKSALLHDLYRKTREVLVTRLSASELHDRSTRQKNKAARSLIRELSDEFPSKLIERHIELMEDPFYFISFTPQEIREHIRTVMRRPAVSALFRQTAGVTEVTIIAQDAPFALSRFCGTLSANDANILDAGIFTRRDGMIIDRFRVVDFVSRSVLTGQQCERFRQELEDVFHGRVDLQDLLSRHRAKWKRRSSPPNPNIRLDVEFEDHPRYTIIDVYAADTLGFLYRITDCISRIGLNIAFAKIATRIDGIVDSFYVTDQGGNKIVTAKRLDEIRLELLRTIRETAESELVLG